jgi:hypothetical protein
MSTELDDLAKAFSALQETTNTLKDEEARAAINRAIDSLLMAIDAIELRLNLLEFHHTGPNARNRRCTSVPKSRRTAA